MRKPPNMETPRGDLRVANNPEIGDPSPSVGPRTSIVYRILLQGWHIVAITATLAAIASIALSLSLQFSFTATTTLYPAVRETSVSTSGLQRLLGVAGPQSISTDEAITTLNSTKFLSAFITNHNYLPIIYARDWNPEAGTWKEQAPTLMKAVRDFRRSMVVTTLPLSLAITVSYTSYDPKVAADTINLMITHLNATMRSEAVERSEGIVAHYQKTLQTGDRIPTDVRAHIVSLMSDEMKTLASAQSTESYAVRVTDPAYAPELRSAPQRTVITIIGTLLGFFVGLLILFTRHFVRSLRANLREDRLRGAAEAS